MAHFRDHSGACSREVVHAINGAGWRGRDAAHEKKPGQTRIACVGDSLMFGLYVAEHDALPPSSSGPCWPRRLDVEVLNFGVSLRRRRQGAPDRVHSYRPDLVLLQLHGGEGGRRAIARLQASDWVTRWLGGAVTRLREPQFGSPASTQPAHA